MAAFETLARIFPKAKNNSGVLISELHSGDILAGEEGDFPITNTILHIAVLRGRMTVCIDGIRCECTEYKNNLVDINPLQRLDNISMSEDFHGFIVVLSKEFMDGTDKDRKPFTVYDVMMMRNYPVVTLPPEALRGLHRYFDAVLNECNDLQDSALDKAIFRHSILLFHLKLVKFMRSERPSDSGQVKRKLTRSASLFEKFTLMLSEDVESCHDVAYYADKLCISPHYLTMIANENAGRSASRMIAEELMSRASILLRNPDLSLQEIAGRLHFSDQSSFGKFFKKHSGKTPSEYRREIV